jgi:hypothetical protein
MTSIIKVDQIQNAAGGVPTAGDLGFNVSGSVINVEHFTLTGNKVEVTTSTYTTAWTVNYTPVSSNSVVFYNYSVSNRIYNNNSADARASIRVLVNGNTLGAELFTVGAYDYGGSGTWIHIYQNVQAKAVNSDGSTMTADYQIRVNGADGISINESNSSSTSYLTITEVAG